MLKSLIEPCFTVVIRLRPVCSGVNPASKQLNFVLLQGRLLGWHSLVWGFCDDSAKQLTLVSLAWHDGWTTVSALEGSVPGVDSEPAPLRRCAVTFTTFFKKEWANLPLEVDRFDCVRLISQERNHQDGRDQLDCEFTKQVHESASPQQPGDGTTSQQSPERYYASPVSNYRDDSPRPSLNLTMLRFEIFTACPVRS